MTDKKIKSILIIAIGLILWILYFCDNEMARYGIYTIFSYNLHELFSVVPLLFFIVTFVWLIFIITSSIRKKDIKPNLILGIILFVLCVAQFSYIHNRSQIATVTCIAEIENIDREKLEITIVSGENHTTLDSPMLVQDLLKTDGTKYCITYERFKNDSNYGKLCMIQAID